MLSLLVTTFNFAKNVSYYGFLLSYKIGQLIVSCLNIALDLFLQISKTVATVLRILVEDFFIFLFDVGQRVSNVVSMVCSLFGSIVNFFIAIIDGIKFIFSSIIFVITVINNGIYEIVYKLISGISQAFVAVKHFFILLGASIWFTITLIPLCIVYLCTMFTYYLGCLLDEIIMFTINCFMNCKSFIKNAYEFVTDVPIESVAGLLAGACILYFIIKFHILLYHKIISLFELIRQAINEARTRMLRRLRALRQEQRDVEEDSSSSTSTASTDTDETEHSERDSHKNENKMCIICEERTKCILMLPCRHICLCSECNTRLRLYNRTCPLCRRFVQSTMKVFL